jgi:hypothetical protein
VDERFEATGVDLVVVEGKPVATACGLDRRGAQHLADPGDADLHLLGPRTGQ